MVKVREYNGHIRNWAVLRGGLGITPDLSREERKKQIIAKAYEKWGCEMASHLYGMLQ